MTILSADYVRIMVESFFYWRKQFRDFPLNYKIYFAWQVQYLVKLSCDACWSAHCK